MSEIFKPHNFPVGEAMLLNAAREQIEGGSDPSAVYDQYAPAITTLSASADRQSGGGVRRIDPLVNLRNLLREHGWRENADASPLGAADWGP